MGSPVYSRHNLLDIPMGSVNRPISSGHIFTMDIEKPEKRAEDYDPSFIKFYIESANIFERAADIALKHLVDRSTKYVSLEGDICRTVRLVQDIYFVERVIGVNEIDSFVTYFVDKSWIVHKPAINTVDFTLQGMARISYIEKELAELVKVYEL